MKPFASLLLALSLALGAGAGAASAAERTVTLAVENMTCASCPYIVRGALREVPGVQKASVSFEDKTARVTFDDSRTALPDLTRATGDAGYPSRPVE